MRGGCIRSADGYSGQDLQSDPTNLQLREALEAQKSAVTLGPWRPTNRPPAIEIRSALQVQGVVVQGLELYLKCSEERPEERVAIGLSIETSIGPKCFARIDWRGTDHPNSSKRCGHLQFFPAGRTHFHNPMLWPLEDDPLSHIRENLPIALAIEDPPQDFRDLLVRCASILNVTNLAEATSPRWQSDSLF